MALSSAIYEGVVRHRRVTPREHRLEQPLFMLYLDLAELDVVFADRWLWSIDRPNVAALRRRDYFGDPRRSIDDAVRDRVEAELGARPDGPIRMLTHLRYLGTTMNPVSFYYGFEPDGETLAFVLAEITNTPWEERYAYLLPTSGARASGDAYVFDFDKRFHVSPFVGMDRRYRWTFSPPTERLLVHMDVLDRGEREFEASLAMARRPMTGAGLARCLARYPLLTARVGAAIYAHAAVLYAKRVPFHDHPKTVRRPRS